MNATLVLRATWQLKRESERLARAYAALWEAWEWGCAPALAAARAAIARSERLVRDARAILQRPALNKVKP